METDPLEIASTLQTASINRAPSPTHDLNPSTAASQKIPITTSTTTSKTPDIEDDASHIDFNENDDDDDVDAASLPSSPTFSAAPPLRPRARHPPKNMPPLPDLRFEQSYLASIQHAATWQQVAWITTRDQMLLPLVQGTLWTLVLAGWKHWNKGARFAGEGVGARLRRWWWGVNNWEMPGQGARTRSGSGFRRFGSEVKEATRGAVSGMGDAEVERKLGVW